MLSRQNPIQVVVVDDDADMRGLVSTLLADHSDIEVVGIAADGQAAIERTGELEPAFVLMDVIMPGMGGIEATRLILATFPSVKVIALSLHNDRHFVAAMRAAGASGYLQKDSLHEELAQALRTVAAGGTWWDAVATEGPG